MMRSTSPDSNTCVTNSCQEISFPLGSDDSSSPRAVRPGKEGMGEREERERDREGGHSVRLSGTGG